MNKVILIGNLTKDPESGITPSGTTFCRFGIAIKRNTKEPDVDFFNVVAWSGCAETCIKYLKKGNKVGVVGRVENRSFEDKEGNKRQITEIIANEVEFLTPKQTEEEPETKTTTVYRQPSIADLEEIDDNQLPF